MLPAEDAVYLDAAGNIDGFPISGGSINGTPIGATTPNTIAGTNISSATAPTNAVPALSLTGTPNSAAGGRTGVLGVGSNFTATDKNIMASFVQNINDYTQIIVQNPNAGTSASADIIINNDNTTGAGVYGDFGINSSTYSGSGSLALPNATYLYSNGGDLVIGTNTAHSIRFVTNAGTDKLVFDSNGNLAIGTTPTNLNLLEIGAGTSAKAPLGFAAGTNTTTADAGSMEFDGVSPYFINNTSQGRGQLVNRQYFRLAADGGTVSTIANFFGATSGITLVNAQWYEVEAELYFLKTTAGTVTFTFTFINAPQNTDVHYIGTPVNGLATVGTAQTAGLYKSTATAAAMPATGALSNNLNHHYTIKAMILANATTGGTLNIRATCSAGSLTPATGSYYTVTQLPTANTGAFV